MFYQKHFPCFAAGKPRYTVPQNILSTKKRIFLVAVPLMNQTSASDNSLVKLRFHHTLTRIAIYVKSDDNTTGKQITAFSIRGMKNGILTCHIPEDSKDKGFGWSYPAPAETETFTATATRFDIPDNTATPKELLATFYLPPYGTESVFNLTYTYQAYNSDNTDITQTIILSNQTLPSTEMWTEGASISYTLGISREAIVAVSMLQNDNWILPINNGGDIAYKPPFFHWCIAALSLPAGEVTEFTSRLPSALAAIIMAIACFLFFAKRSRNDIAFLASLLLLSGFEVHRAAMASRVDMVLTCFIVLAMLQLYGW